MSLHHLHRPSYSGLGCCQGLQDSLYHQQRYQYVVMSHYLILDAWVACCRGIRQCRLDVWSRFLVRAASFKFNFMQHFAGADHSPRKNPVQTIPRRVQPKMFTVPSSVDYDYDYEMCIVVSPTNNTDPHSHMGKRYKYEVRLGGHSRLRQKQRHHPTGRRACSSDLVRKLWSEASAGTHYLQSSSNYATGSSADMLK